MLTNAFISSIDNPLCMLSVNSDLEIKILMNHNQMGVEDQNPHLCPRPFSAPGPPLVRKGADLVALDLG